MEIVTFILTIAGFIIAYITYKKSYFDDPKEDLNHLIYQYDFAKRSTIELIDALTLYADKNHCFHAEFMQGLTFLEAIKVLQNAQSVLFTSENLINLTNSNMGKKQLNNLEKRIDIHINGIQDIKTHLNFYYKKDFSVDGITRA